jgi:hypothetical protein
MRYRTLQWNVGRKQKSITDSSGSYRRKHVAPKGRKVLDYVETARTTRNSCCAITRLPPISSGCRNRRLQSAAHGVASQTDLRPISYRPDLRGMPPPPGRGESCGIKWVRTRPTNNEADHPGRGILIRSLHGHGAAIHVVEELSWAKYSLCPSLQFFNTKSKSLSASSLGGSKGGSRVRNPREGLLRG